MPRVEQQIIGTSLYIYSTADAATGGSQSGGSGVLIGQPTGLSSSWVHLYAVTNAHVVEAGGVVVRAGTRDGQPKIFDLRYEEWKLHPRGEDVAVCWLGRVPTGDDRELQWVPRDWFATEADFGLVTARDEWGHPWTSGPIVAGEDTFSVARFVGYDGIERNQPVVRFGNLSSPEPVPVYQGAPRHREQLSLLVEARSLAGASGAPVFAYRTGGYYGGGTPPVDRAIMLGVNWGHIRHPKDAAHEFAVELGKPSPGRYNSGMMAVVPAWRVTELLDDDDVVAVRAEIERHMAAREGEAEMDLSTGAGSDFERFESLTRRLVRVPKAEVDDKRKEGKS